MQCDQLERELGTTSSSYEAVPGTGLRTVTIVGLKTTVKLQYLVRALISMVVIVIITVVAAIAIITIVLDMT